MHKIIITMDMGNVATIIPVAPIHQNIHRQMQVAMLNLS